MKLILLAIVAAAVCLGQVSAPPPPIIPENCMGDSTRNRNCMPEKPAACLVINAGVSTEPGGCTLDDVTLWETLPAAPDRAAV
ncbi:hypothetical protein PC114_g23208 [Phytophthora cactorum]|uniref:Uncharacterized protein n=1 Tax=Phytophthora cactorum TaxID=29920 RepID=A0A8T1ATP5_9STRA|nr:hypothetical protein PC114_g23208 [Phytophthora cactorum]KAG2886459.1 hypothetical protein PC115_g20675 [Phytophthora cactorum]